MFIQGFVASTISAAAKTGSPRPPWFSYWSSPISALFCKSAVAVKIGSKSIGQTTKKRTPSRSARSGFANRSRNTSEIDSVQKLCILANDYRMTHNNRIGCQCVKRLDATVTTVNIKTLCLCRRNEHHRHHEHKTEKDNLQQFEFHFSLQKG